MMRKVLWWAAPSVAAETGCMICSYYRGGSGSRELGLDTGLVQKLQDLLLNDPVLPAKPHLPKVLLPHKAVLSAGNLDSNT